MQFDYAKLQKPFSFSFDSTWYSHIISSSSLIDSSMEDAFFKKSLHNYRTISYVLSYGRQYPSGTNHSIKLLCVFSVNVPFHVLLHVGSRDFYYFSNLSIGHDKVGSRLVGSHDDIVEGGYPEQCLDILVVSH